ncbi:sensor histidine kinase [Sporomusa sp.]|jgi:LytS/YehU family sensor histidine kinase|uniref:sensor histidine kinase n=1 Tax=Sporomusa sp. TaxID=2078658 RepID=UPI002C4F9944|nr:PocR ligand-binding domain-containing protein [Sporomusa sp.]HWR07157.1 PocR ligand-binding domain-containing protein [Sporomusa sp.]
MKLAEKMKLTDIIDMNTLYGIQEKMGKLIDIPQITTDTEGIPVGKISNFIPFCRLIRSSPKGSQQCMLCDQQAGRLAMAEKQRRIYTCHTGLIDCAAPIIVNDFHVGSVLGGQVLLKGEKTRDSIDIERISRQFDISLDVLKVAVEFIPIVSREQLQDSVECYSLLANYIDQIGVNRLAKEQLLMEAQEKILLEQKARQMKLKTIQAQMHPHFLFNTLNSIARMALLENASQTEELIYSLSDLLRYNLKNEENFPKIRDDISNISKYLFIQSQSYSDRVSYEIDIDESVMDYRIPSMILQPIVENSMIHGLETKREGGKIEIVGRLISERELEIKITDNGKGIKAEILNLIRQTGINSNKQLGIGLVNTYDRLRHYFGECCGLTIESAPNVGTCVSIRIPCVQEYS